MSGPTATTAGSSASFQPPPSSEEGALWKNIGAGGQPQRSPVIFPASMTKFDAISAVAQRPSRRLRNRPGRPGAATPSVAAWLAATGGGLRADLPQIRLGSILRLGSQPDSCPPVPGWSPPAKGRFPAGRQCLLLAQPYPRLSRLAIRTCGLLASCRHRMCHALGSRSCPVEERHHGCVELFVEGRPIEATRIGAQHPRQQRRHRSAGRQE